MIICLNRLEQNKTHIEFYTKTIFIKRLLFCFKVKNFLCNPNNKKYIDQLSKYEAFQQVWSGGQYFTSSESVSSFAFQAYKDCLIVLKLFIQLFGFVIYYYFRQFVKTLIVAVCLFDVNQYVILSILMPDIINNYSTKSMNLVLNLLYKSTVCHANIFFSLKERFN